MRDVVLVQDPISFKKRHDCTRRAALERAGETSLQSVLFQGGKNAAIFDSSVKFFTMSHARLLPSNISYNPIGKLQLDHFDKLDKLKSL